MKLVDLQMIALLGGCALANGATAAPGPETEAPTGYSDTPMIPGSRWRVHDDARPRPPVVRPGRDAGQPPSDAVVLFDGRSLDAWQTDKGAKAGWRVEHGYVEVVGGTGDLVSKQKFGDCQLHVEFSSPKPPQGHSQERGNSGVFLAGVYEVQVLDSFDNLTYADGQASAIYGQAPPLVNASRAPGEWQSYDILYTSPRFKDGKIATPGYLTVLHNGVVTQNHTQLLGGTVHRALPLPVVHDVEAPLKLQDHGMPVRYRNIWIRPLSAAAP